MFSWLGVESFDPHLLVGGLLVAALLAIVFFVLWLLARRARHAGVQARRDLELDLDDAETDLSEQSARMRMVRELHEVAINSVTGIINQAEGARYKGETEPAAAVRAAALIADSARGTLADLRRVVSIMRQGEAYATPQPSIKTARELFRVMREAGLNVRYEDTGERFGLEEAAELAIYRILQEALSNALKYGGEGTEVRVTFKWSEQGLTLLVDDDGIRAATRRAGGDPNEISRIGGYSVEDDAVALTSTPSGLGLTEMRERTEMFGGAFNAFVVPGVGFSVSAAFPALRYDNGVHGVNLRRE